MNRTLRALYICYLSLEDPLVHSQVVAYLEGLAARGHTIHLLTFEPRPDDEASRRRREELAARGITWHARRYHKRPSLPATIYDALAGAVTAARLLRRHRLDAVHARSHVPAAMGLIVRRVTGCRLIFDLRGLMAEEYVDAGRWKYGGVPFRITKRVERAAIAAADAMVVLTHRVRGFLFDGRPEPPLEVIPCCADLTTIEEQRVARDAARAELGFGESPVLIYVGKFTGWYMEREMVDFFAAARKELPDLRLLIVTQADRDPALAELRRHRLPEDAYRITSAAPGEIGRYLAAADAGIAFIRPCPSKISSSPTKVGEYLAAGLPVVSGTGIGDVDALLAADDVGVLVPEFEASAYSRAAMEMAAKIGDPAVPERCRAVAERELSLADVGIPRYHRLYRRVAEAGA